MSKAVKTVIGVAAAIAIPFAAPAIASSIGLSAAIGATAGSALVGAGLGAVRAKVLDQDVETGALFGALGGGLGGYNAAQAAAAPAATAAAPAAASVAGPGLTTGVGESLYSLTPGVGGGLAFPTSASLATEIAGAAPTFATPFIPDYSFTSLAPTLSGTGAGLSIGPALASSPFSLSSLAPTLSSAGEGLVMGPSPFVSAPAGGIAVAPGASPILGEPTSFVNMGPSATAPTFAAPTPEPMLAPAPAPVAESYPVSPVGPAPAAPATVDYSLPTGGGLTLPPALPTSPYDLANMPIYGGGSGLAVGPSPFVAAPGGGIAVAPGVSPVLGEPTSFVNLVPTSPYEFVGPTAPAPVAPTAPAPTAPAPTAPAPIAPAPIAPTVYPPVDYSLPTGGGLTLPPAPPTSPYDLANMPIYGGGSGLVVGTPPFVSGPGGIAPAPGVSPILGDPGSFINQLPTTPPPTTFGPPAPGPAPAPAPTTRPTGPTATPPTNINPATGKPYTFEEALAALPGQLAAQFADPAKLADMILRAGGVLAGSALAGEGLSDAEKSLLAAQTEELRRLQEENRALFNQRLEQAQALIGESKYFDPEYFGLQRARRAQIAGARAKRAGLRGLTGASREAAARKYELETARNVGTAFDEGFGTGVRGRYQALQTGLQMMPEAFPSSMGAYETIRGSYSQAAQRRDQRAGQIGDLFGSITGGQQAKKP